MPQVVMKRQEEPEQPGVGSVGRHRFDAQGSQSRQWRLEGTFVQQRRAQLTVATAVGRDSLAWRQPDEPPRLQLEQQGSARHVLETSRRVATSPESAPFTGEPRPMPRLMLGQQPADLRHILIS